MHMGAESGGSKLLTGIPGVDMICGGGFPRGGMVLVVGDSGTGKTSLAYEFLIRGALKGEKGMIITSNAPVEKYISQLMPFAFREGDAPGEGITVMPMNCDNMDIKGYLEIIGNIGDTAQQANVTRLVMDPLPRSLLSLNEPQLVTVFNMLSASLYDKGLTAMMITDAPRFVESSISDGMIRLGAEDRDGDILRTFQVMKMRGASHSLSRYAMTLSEQGMIMSRLIKKVME